MNNGIKDPVNHKLSNDELNSKDYDSFMDILTDVPESVPLKPIDVTNAGITSQSIYISLKDPLDQTSVVTLYVDVSMHVNLTGHRGIHMSRCIESLLDLSKETHGSLDEFTGKLALELVDKQKSETSRVKAKAIYQAKRLTKATKKESQDMMYLYAESSASTGGVKTRIGIKAYNMTGCPCTETHTKFTVVPALKSQGFDLEQIQTILETTISGTHTQRGTISAYVTKSAQYGYSDLYAALDTSCHLVYELLKRPDEHELVVRALKNPQFTEDVVRDVASAIVSNPKDLDPESEIQVISTLFDSIHIHDVNTEITAKISSLRTED